jgi:DNA-binding CsgD family transcriptional regulator
MEPQKQSIVTTTEKSHWKNHHPAAGYTKWMSVIDENIVHTWIDVETKSDIILDFMDVELLQVVLTESDLMSRQFHILFDLDHISDITFNYKRAITNLFFNWSPILGVIGFYNIPESMHIIVETFAAVAPQNVCVIQEKTYEKSIKNIIEFKAGKFIARESEAENNNLRALHNKFLEAVARISWLNMLDQSITMPPDGHPYSTFFKAIDYLRSDLIEKEREKEHEVQLLKQDFEERITRLVIKMNAQAEVNNKSARERENEIADLTLRIKTQEIELARVSIVIADKKKEVRNLLDKIYSLDIDPGIKRALTNSCLNLIEKEVIEKQLNRETTESDSIFLSKLQKKFPNLNQRELRISLLVKLNYDTTEIARSIGLSTRGMESIRYRIHKKLGLGKHQSIKTFLSELDITEHTL